MALSTDVLRLNIFCNDSVLVQIQIRDVAVRRTWSFHVVGLWRTTKNSAKIYNERAQPLFCSLNLLFQYCRSRCRRRRGLLKLSN